jgi:hypothetical protein
MKRLRDEALRRRRRLTADRESGRRGAATLPLQHPRRPCRPRLCRPSLQGRRQRTVCPRSLLIQHLLWKSEAAWSQSSPGWQLIRCGPRSWSWVSVLQLAGYEASLCDAACGCQPFISAAIDSLNIQQGETEARGSSNSRVGVESIRARCSNHASCAPFDRERWSLRSFLFHSHLLLMRDSALAQRDGPDGS